MGRGSTTHPQYKKSEVLLVRLDPAIKTELQEFAASLGMSMSKVVYAHIKDMLRTNRLSISGEARYSLAEAEKRAKEMKAREFYDSIKWSELDAYDG
jgi:hypothetical protein